MREVDMMKAQNIHKQMHDLIDSSRALRLPKETSNKGSRHYEGQKVSPNKFQCTQKWYSPYESLSQLCGKIQLCIHTFFANVYTDILVWAGGPKCPKFCHCLSPRTDITQQTVMIKTTNSFFYTTKKRSISDQA